MNKICGYSCKHSKGGVCQITGCDKKIVMTTTTEPQILTKWQDPTIEEYKQLIKNWKEKYYQMKEERDKYEEVIDKIKEYTDKLIAEANMFAGDDIDYYMNYEYSVRDIVEYKKILEEIE